MTEYKCKHNTSGVIIMDSNELSYANYFEWSESVGVFGTRELCFDCYCNKLEQSQKQEGVING